MKRILEGSATAEPKIKTEKFGKPVGLPSELIRRVGLPPDRKNCHVGTGETCPRNRAGFVRPYIQKFRRLKSALVDASSTTG
ncbi:MAG: hypothetical protein N3B10_00065 [Armatimonadetes bacterium]|nr:hypothetical protein [Armatimonadota bacterium]MCX7966863.1 hypothetical protein [Armatimonadota bacterium]MDW8141821.1 hypothetical protein [Armatimonadota bacterium]